MNMLPWWAGNSLFLIGFFVVCIFVALILMWPLKGRKHPDWKWIDLMIVLVGTVGLFGLTFQSNFTATQIEAPYKKAQEEYLRHWISTLIDQAELDCVPQPRLTSPLPNNDDVQDDRRNLCEWATSNFKTHAALIVQGKDEIFDTSRWAPFPKLKTDVGSAVPFQNQGEWFFQAAQSWDEGVAVIKKATEVVPQSDAYRAVIFLGPYILAIAIAVQVVKIFYEKRG